MRRLYATRYAAAIEATFPGLVGPMAVVDAGHWLHAERPDHFVRLVKGFMDGEL